jgi:phage-related protein
MNSEYKMEKNSIKMEGIKKIAERYNKMMEERKEKMVKIEETMKPYFDKLPKETRDKLNTLRVEKEAQMAEKMKKYEGMAEKMKTMSYEEIKRYMKEIRKNKKNKKEEMKKDRVSHFAKLKEIV